MSDERVDIPPFPDLSTPDPWLRSLEREKARVKKYLGLEDDADLFRLLILAADKAVRERQVARRKCKEVKP